MNGTESGGVGEREEGEGGALEDVECAVGVCGRKGDNGAQGSEGDGEEVAGLGRVRRDNRLGC